MIARLSALLPCSRLMILGGLLYLSASAQAQLQAQAQTPSAVEVDAVRQDFQAQQQLLAQGFQALLQRGATPQQLQAWQDANADLFQEQQQRAVVLGAYSAAQPLAYVQAVNIPPGATPVLADFLVAQANLFNSYAALHNQAVATPGSSNDSVQATFQAQNAAELQAQVQRAQTLADQPATQPMPVPPPLTIPPGTSPVMAAFLSVRDQIARQHVTLWNQFLGQPVAARDAALQQWQRQNQALFQQMQLLAQQMAQQTAQLPTQTKANQE